MRDTHITLAVRETGADPQQTFLFHVLVDGEVVAGNQSLPPGEAKAVRQFVDRYNALFKQGGRPRLAAENLNALGADLFSLWLGQIWDKVQARVPSGAQRWLVIASDVPDVLNLPWELLRLPGGDFLGFDPRFSVRRLPWPDRSLAAFDGPLLPRPLRILFMACAPQDQALLDYEREEESLLRSIAGVGPNVAYDSGDLGTFEELRQRVNEFQPHIVHLSGHGIVARQCPDCGRLNAPGNTACGGRECAASLVGMPALGYFAFEDERGRSDMRSSVEIRQELFGGSGVQCVFVSGCQSGKAPPVAALGGICQGLVGDEVPLAIGWAASVADDTATQFAHTFYNTLAAGRPVDRALTQARQAMRRTCQERGDPSWTLPVLYAATTQGLIFDPDPRRPSQPPSRPTVVQQALPGMTEGHAEHFVGRRREQQRLLPPLRQGRFQTVLITGLGGAGKSTLATRLARKLEADGFTLIPVPSSRDNPLSAARLLGTCGKAFRQAARQHQARGETQRAAELKAAAGDLANPDLPVADRLRDVVATLNQGRFVLVLDNFEVNLDEATRRILDRELAGFYAHMLHHLSGGSRALITSRYLLADVPSLPFTAHEEPLADFPEGAFLKFLLRDPVVERRYRTGELPYDLLWQLHRLLGGTPRFLDQIRRVLKTITAKDLRRELAAIKLPAEEPSILREARDHYCKEILIARLYGYLSLDSQRALSRVAVYGVPINLAGLAAASGLAPMSVRVLAQEWRDYSLLYITTNSQGNNLWIIYPVIRDWLLASERLSEEEQVFAHRRARSFLNLLLDENRQDELGISTLDMLLEIHRHCLAAEDIAEAEYISRRVREQALSDWQQVIGTLIEQGNLAIDVQSRLTQPILALERIGDQISSQFLRDELSRMKLNSKL
jgi:hypothetical protein